MRTHRQECLCHTGTIHVAQTLVVKGQHIVDSLVAQHIVDILKAQYIVDKRWELYDAAEGGSVEWMVMKWRECWRWIGIGEEDFLLDGEKKLEALLKEQNVRFTSNVTKGGHTWTVWRHHLRDFLPLLFR